MSGAMAGLVDLGRVLIDGTLYTVRSARVRATAAGNTQIVAAVADRSIRPIAWAIGPVSAATEVTLQDTAGTPVILVGPFPYAENGGDRNSVYKESDQQGTSGLAVNVNLSVASNVTVHVWYVEVA